LRNQIDDRTEQFPLLDDSSITSIGYLDRQVVIVELSIVGLTIEGTLKQADEGLGLF
jgi:hypothetical protein